MIETTPSSPDRPAPATAGQWLREARTRQGVHLAMLSASLKVPVRSLEHLEADRYDELPGATFVRALAQSICRQLRIDPAPVLALLPEREVRASAVPPSLQSAMPPGTRRTGPWLDRQQLAYAALASIMLIVIAALLWWPAKPVGDLVAPVSGISQEVIAVPGPSSAAAPVSPSGVEPEGQTVTQPPNPTDSMSAAPAPVMTSPAAVADSANPAGPGTALAPASAPSTSPVQPIRNAPTLRLMASGESWVEVRDAANRVVLNMVMQAGQQQDIVEPAPLKVVLGRAAVMKAQVRGQSFDLAPHTKITVARFEVQP